ncbi:MAG: single-stranded-DNA-specific exonuclease RecJ [Oscillospiraceae bacterium]|nr:single-stranded-DNA-specific exonuclease RecJ [Oscillospiraceae bacterium]
MEYTVKYGTWNISQFDSGKLAALCEAGYSPLAARVLCSRGYTEPMDAKAFLSASGPMPEPGIMQDMDKAAERVRLALQRGETIAVYGDYDVDGITATCLLTEFLRSQGGNVEYYIPARIEEGYGLNTMAVAELKHKGVSLIVTVDCGITAIEEAEYCLREGVDLIITDHHECKEQLPRAVAVVDPHRKDDSYPHRNLAGVGVAFKLAAAIVGSQEIILDRFCDLLCLGTVADVMPLVGENRVFVAKGLQVLTHEPRPGIVALMAECGSEGTEVTATTIGYTLAPRINAAGRMGQVELATELFLTNSPARAAELAKALCQLNRRRQEVEAEIYKEAQSMLRGQKTPSAIVLAGETWHQGVVGIVASRLAEEYGCPAYLVCLDGERGKASSRSYGGFNLFASLEQLSHLLESFGGHELAAGFTIARSQIDTFREQVSRLAAEFVASGQQRAALMIDCCVEPELLNETNVMALDQLEPCGAGCPKPVLYMDGMYVDQLSEVGGGKHLRLRLSRDGVSLGAIFFSATASRCGISQGDRVEVAFTPQINDFRGVRSVQLNLVDLRPDQGSAWHIYERYAAGQTLSAAEAEQLLPDRREFAALWRYLTAMCEEEKLSEERAELAKKLRSATGMDWSAARVQLCLDVLRERGLLTFAGTCEKLQITLCRSEGKVDLEQSPIMIKLKQQKGAV